jgi:predicted amidohydrolase
MASYVAAAVQMNSQPDIDLNFENARKWIREAVNQGAKLVGLPEYFSFLGDLKERQSRSDEISKKSAQFLKDTASEFGVTILGGTIPVPAGNGKTFNRSLLIDSSGEILASYDKIHLFDVDLSDDEQYRESDDIEHGKNDPITFKTQNLGTFGLSVCYDLRFPELYRALMNELPDILTVPSAFTATTGKDHWEPLLRARAIENTAYVFAPAQTGTHGKKRVTHGHAMIIDPWGTIIADAGTREGIALAKIDSERVLEVRRQIPSLNHRVL